MNTRAKRFRFIKNAAMVLAVFMTTVLFVFLVFRGCQEANRAEARRWREMKQRFVQEWVAQTKQELSDGETDWVPFYSTTGTDTLVSRFAGMPEIKQLSFWGTDITDRGVKVIAGLPNLESLTLMNGRVSNSGLAMLNQNQNLEELYLINLNLTDSGLSVLQSFPQLKKLAIYRRPGFKRLLTDAAVNGLKDLSQLEKLEVGGWISKNAIAELRSSLPNCEIIEVYDEDLW